MSSLTQKQRRAIDHSKEKLVPAAEKLLNEANVVAMDPNQFGDSQLRNLIAVANETESSAVVTNFIRYQMGRDGNARRNWANECNGQALGDRFITEMESGVIQHQLGTIEGLDDETRQLARITLIRYFLGFASRHLKYLHLQRPKRNGGER